MKDKYSSRQRAVTADRTFAGGPELNLSSAKSLDLLLL